jgi:phosphoglycerate dehydrogenase-like enzyme
LTPHVAGTTPHYLGRALDVFLANAERLLQGEPALTPVDVAAGY